MYPMGMELAALIREMGLRGESAYDAVNGEDIIDIPAQACHGRSGNGKTFSGMMNLHNGQLRLDCADDPCFHLTIDFTKVPGVAAHSMGDAGEEAVMRNRKRAKMNEEEDDKKDDKKEDKKENDNKIDGDKNDDIEKKEMGYGCLVANNQLYLFHLSDAPEHMKKRLLHNAKENKKTIYEDLDSVGNDYMDDVQDANAYLEYVEVLRYLDSKVCKEYVFQPPCHLPISYTFQLAYELHD
jgi:hypothetical protein